MNLIRIAIERPIAVVAAVLMVVMFGMVALQTIPIQLSPDVHRPVITVTTLWPGAAPAEIERETGDTRTPVEVAEGNELVTLWSLPSIESFWAMRAGSGAPELATWWEESDRLVESRERKFMTPAEIS